MSLSSSACPMMLCLRDRLLSLNQLLEVSLFQLTWQALAERLDHFLYQDVSHRFYLQTLGYGALRSSSELPQDSIHLLIRLSANLLCLSVMSDYHLSASLDEIYDCCNSYETTTIRPLICLVYKK